MEEDTFAHMSLSAGIAAQQHEYVRGAMHRPIAITSVLCYRHQQRVLQRSCDQQRKIHQLLQNRARVATYNTLKTPLLA